MNGNGNGNKVNKRRSEMDIINEILVLSKAGVNKAKILYECNLSYTLLQKYMSYLLTNKLLEENKDDDNLNRKFYTTTQKGIEFLQNMSYLVNK